jgi:hypothetical protein
LGQQVFAILHEVLIGDLALAGFIKNIVVRIVFEFDRHYDFPLLLISKPMGPYVIAGKLVLVRPKGLMNPLHNTPAG